MPPKGATGKGKGKQKPSGGGDDPPLSSDKLPLALFLKYLTSGPSSRGSPALTMSQAIQLAAKLVPAGYASPAALARLTQVDMAALGIDDEDLRKGVMALIAPKAGGRKPKRKRESDLDKPLPTSKPVEVVQTALDFDEILHEETLLLKSCVVNRAPVMAAWAFIVAERLGFDRQEALSIAQAYTDLNATSKGVSLGIYDSSAADQANSAGPSQPYVDLMGRRVPVLSLQNGAWRGISAGAVREPSEAFEYIKRSFRQQMGAVVGALRLLSLSYSPSELNENGYGMYIEFRPEASGWGEKTEMFCRTILDLRKETPDPGVAAEQATAEVVIPGKEEGERETQTVERLEEAEQGARKKLKPAPPDDQDDVNPYDAALDDDLDLSALDGEF